MALIGGQPRIRILCKCHHNCKPSSFPITHKSLIIGPHSHLNLIKFDFCTHLQQEDACIDYTNAIDLHAFPAFYTYTHSEAANILTKQTIYL